MRNLWIDEKNLRDFGVIVSGENSFDSAEWQYEKQEIPGRNGDLLIPQKRFANISVKYPAFIMRDFAKKVPELRNFLLSAGAAYRKIEDDYYPKTYRLGIFSGPLSFEAGFLNKTGQMNLVFDCKPQRFLNPVISRLKFPTDRNYTMPGCLRTPSFASLAQEMAFSPWGKARWG